MQYDIIGGGSVDADNVKFFTIGNLIELCLEHLDKTFRLIGTDYTVGDLHSWRGVYSLPAISYGDGDKTGEQIAHSLIASLKVPHCGWKGGDYTYTRNNEFYVSEVGRAEDYKVCGYKAYEGEVVLLTKLDPY